MSADESRLVTQEIPFGGSRLYDVVGIDTHFVKDKRKFVNKRYIEVALRIFDDFRCLGYLYRWGFVCARLYNGAIQIVYSVGYLGSRAGGYLFYLGQNVYLIAGVDAFGRVTREKVSIEYQSRYSLYLGNTIFFGAAGVSSGFVNNDIAFGYHSTHCLRGFYERFEVGGKEPIKEDEETKIK